MVEFDTQPNWKPRDVATRLAHVFGGEGSSSEKDCPPFSLESGYWQLDRANNWHMALVGPARYRLTYRYGRQGMLEGLVPFLQFVFRD